MRRPADRGPLAAADRARQHRARRSRGGAVRRTHPRRRSRGATARTLRDPRARGARTACAAAGPGERPHARLSHAAARLAGARPAVALADRNPGSGGTALPERGLRARRDPLGASRDAACRDHLLRGPEPVSGGSRARRRCGPHARGHRSAGGGGSHALGRERHRAPGPGRTTLGRVPLGFTHRVVFRAADGARHERGAADARAARGG